MLFQQRFWAGLADGTVTMTFRRWKRQQVLPGRRYRTPAGLLEIESVDLVSPDDITDTEAERAGYPSAKELVADLRGEPGQPVYRIAFHHVDEPDPRSVLAANDDLSDDDVAELDRRLARLDKASPMGPWTMTTLELIADHPAVRAGDLAAKVGRERLPFKADVRKLKNLGLTISLPVGYRLSPRGQAYLARKRNG